MDDAVTAFPAIERSLVIMSRRLFDGKPATRPQTLDYIVATHQAEAGETAPHNTTSADLHAKREEAPVPGSRVPEASSPGCDSSTLHDQQPLQCMRTSNSLLPASRLRDDSYNLTTDLSISAPMHTRATDAAVVGAAASDAAATAELHSVERNCGDGKEGPPCRPVELSVSAESPNLRQRSNFRDLRSIRGGLSKPVRVAGGLSASNALCEDAYPRGLPLHMVRPPTHMLTHTSVGHASLAANRTAGALAGQHPVRAHSCGPGSGWDEESDALRLSSRVRRAVTQQHARNRDALSVEAGSLVHAGPIAGTDIVR